jgi:hypothetical protein
VNSNGTFVVLFVPSAFNCKLLFVPPFLRFFALLAEAARIPPTSLGIFAWAKGARGEHLRQEA